MKKKILCLAMTAIMVVGASMTAYAKDHQGKDGWTAVFDGKDINSNFESADVADQMTGVQPGDSIELKVQLKNSDSGKTDWYMANEIIQTLEDTGAEAAGGIYEYRLSYIGSDNQENVLYDSATVGGEGASNSGEGLHQASEALKDYFYLGRLNKGQTGTAKLWIKVDGETQGNGYQQTLAKLQMKFAVEKVSEGGTTTTNRIIKQVVKTGDTSKTLLFCGLALASGIVLLIFGIIAMKKKRKRKGE